MKDFSVVPVLSSKLGDKVTNQHSLLVQTLSSIWRAVSGSVQDQAAIREVESGLKQLAA